MTRDQLKPNKVLRGPVFAESVEVLVAIPMGDAVKLVGRGLQSGKAIDIILTDEKLKLLETTPDTEPFDGDSKMFRLGIEAMRLGLAFEYDPYFSLSIARVDPLPHQLEAVYDYFLRLPRIRFLLADDPGAGKTIMAGLLIKELKIRGLVKRILIITPASLSFQWQRELKDKFRENFEVIRSDILRANYGSNPWQDKNQVVTSVSWVSRIPDAKESLMRSQWDLIIVDEAHKMSASSRDRKTLAYQLGEALSGMTDHYLLMTATPHKGDADNFCLFLELLDRDVYGDVKSLEEAMKKHEAPFYLRRVKEALVTFPDPDTGKVKTLFTKRCVQTTEFQISDQEWDFYDALTRYVEDQSIKAASEDSARGRALGFTMAMLQRRFASSIYAVRRSLERMRDKREKILADPEGYRQDQINKRLPDDFDDLPDEEQQEIVAELEDLVVSYDPATLRQEIVELGQLIAQARQLEKSEVESKLVKLRELLKEHGIFKDPKMKLLLFSELIVNSRYRRGTTTEPGFTMSYRIPPGALASGVTTTDFKRKATAIQDTTALNEADDIIRYVHSCSSRLTVPTSLVEIADPIRSATAHEFSRRVFWGDFNIRYGDNGRRLFHSIIEMPRDARANLVFKDGGPPLFEYDIKSCHPVLLLPLFTDSLEKAKFATVLDHDVYSTIRDVMGIPEERDAVKIEFMVCMNSTDRYVAASRGAVYCFFAKYFPVFTREVLDTRSDLAVYLQRHESEIMVRELGRICSERDLFWIPCHDGWLGIEEAEGEILKKVREAFFRETGYAVRVSRTELATGNTTSLVGEISSYDGIEPTSTDPNYRNSAEDWYAALPKHPEPVAEVLKERAEGRKHRKEALRDHRRRVNDAERLRKELAPLWNRIMNHTGQDAA